MTTTEPTPADAAGPPCDGSPSSPPPTPPTGAAPPPADPGTGVVGDLDGSYRSGRATPPPPGTGVVGLARRAWRGRPDDPAWVRPALVGLLATTAVLYLWGLSASGWANAYYSAAAQAGSESWSAFFFGASDAAGSITVDKPPLSLWPSALSVRLFGLSSWSVLVPHALMGVASVGVLYAAVRRTSTASAGLLAGAVLALTPVATLMFRYNNPEALLVLLMTLAAYAALRAIEDGRTRWFVLTGVLIGLGFLTKHLQVLLVVPGFALAHLVAGSASIWRRLRDLVVAGVAMVAGAGWWVAVVELWPEDARPYIGGSQGNSVMELVLGYNGFGRLTGVEIGSVGGGGGPGGGAGPTGGGPQWGDVGITRLLDGVIGGQIAWLLPAALAALVGGLWVTRRAPRTDRRRAGLLVWGGWLAVTAVTFSFMEGIFHEYYTVALAPAIAALVGIGGALVWQRRSQPAAAGLMAVVVAATGWWSATLLGRAPDWQPWLTDAVVAATIVLAVLLLAVALVPGDRWRSSRAGALGGLAAAAIIVGLLGPTAWSLQTVTSAHGGGIVTAGPTVADGANRPGRGPLGAGPAAGGVGPGVDGTAAGGGPGGAAGPGGAPLPGADGSALGGPPDGGPAVGVGPAIDGAPLPPGVASGDRAFGGAQVPDGGAVGGGAQVPDGGAGRTAPGGLPPGGSTGGGAPGRPGGGLLDGTEVSDELRDLLTADADRFTWVAATTGSQLASSYQLATEEPVMPIGGFNGSDPSPTLEEFQAHVADGEIHWYLTSGVTGMRSMGGSQEASRIAEWVTAEFEPTTVGGVTLYDLTR